MQITNVVIGNIDMLRSLCQVRVLSQSNRPLVITAHINSLVVAPYVPPEPHIPQDLSYPLTLLSSKAHGSVFCLGGSCGNGRLLAARKKHRATSYQAYRRCDTLAVRFVGGVISITIHHQVP